MRNYVTRQQEKKKPSTSAGGEKLTKQTRADVRRKDASGQKGEGKKKREWREPGLFPSLSSLAPFFLIPLNPSRGRFEQARAQEGLGVSGNPSTLNLGVRVLATKVPPLVRQDGTLTD